MATKKIRKKVFVGLSGGVDSSVAAALLIKQGYEVTGVFIKNYSDEYPDSYKGPCWIDDRRDALRVAAHLGISLLIFDFEKEFKKYVVDYLFREYAAGRTPNPDVMCNKMIKFPLLWQEAKKCGADFIATGHYARVKKIGSEYRLFKGADPKKDQSYFLYTLSQEILSRVLFPVGGLSKVHVRKLAKEFDLPTKDKAESMGICFVGEVRINDFLKQKIKPQKGNIIDLTGKILGKHNGAAFYTIGEHAGIGGGGPYFIISKDVKRNVLVAAPGAQNKALFKKETLLEDVIWISGLAPKLPLRCVVRLRHGHVGGKAKIIKTDECFRIIFDKPERAITSGQSAVFYKGDECLGGGVIV